MKTILKRMLIAGFNRSFLREGFVTWCFYKFDLRSI